ncbi:hypothetical protein DL98DRAFT_650893 [Cadophora sp. DSE1049]|nr:hypothetical protein DL98DRAFT_650893 [Cadophora sp. DSE1049]
MSAFMLANGILALGAIKLVGSRYNLNCNRGIKGRWSVTALTFFDHESNNLIYMAQTTRIAADLASNGTAWGDGPGQRTDVLQTVNFVTTILVISLLTPLMLVKIYIKRFVVGGCCREDTFCLFAWFMTTAYCVAGLLMARHGGGSHEWEVSREELITFQKILYADTILYGPAAFLTKTTLLLIFTRVFAHCTRTVKFIYAFITVMACYYVPVLMLKIRLCTPIEGLWDPSVETMCFNQQSIFFTDAIVSVVTDVMVLLLPGPLVCTLNVSKCKRLRIGALLGAGGLATIASIWRAVLVWSPTAYEDITVTFVRINLLGIAEVGIGIVCACVPTFNILFTRYTKEHWGSATRCAATGERSPALKTNRIRRLTGDGRGSHVWRKGHRYNKSLGSEAGVDGEGEEDVVVLESVVSVGDGGEGEGSGEGSNGCKVGGWCKKKKEKRRTERETARNLDEDTGMNRDVEREAGLKDAIQTERADEHESESVRDMDATRRNRKSEEDSGWPLSGGGSVVPSIEGGKAV